MLKDGDGRPRRAGKARHAARGASATLAAALLTWLCGTAAGPLSLGAPADSRESLGFLAPTAPTVLQPDSPAPPAPAPPVQPAPIPAPVPAPAQQPTPTPSPGPSSQPATPGAAPAPPGTAPPAPGAEPKQKLAPAQPKPPATPPRPGDDESRQGLEALQRGDLLEARTHFEKALGLDPDNQIAHSRLSYLRFRRGDYAGSVGGAENAIRLDPADTLSYIILGRAREAQGEADKALAAYTLASDLSARAPTPERLVASALAHYLRALQRIQKHESTDVEGDLKEALRVYPRNAYIHYEYGLFLIGSGRAEESLQALGKAEEDKATFVPQENWIYPNRRYLFLDENIRFWKGVALRTLAGGASQAGTLDEAIAQFEPLLAKVQGLAGSVLTHQESSASVALEGKVETSFYNVHYEAALAQEAKGEKAKALALLKTLLKLELADVDTQRRAKELQKRLK